MSKDPSPNGIPLEQLAALSHEFRTPLNGVLGMARLLDSTRLTAEQRAYVAALNESGGHLLGLVNDVLDYAKLGAAGMELSLAAVDVEDVLRSVSELMSPRAHEKDLEIGWAAEAGLEPILADEGRLKQILLNFAGNAVKFAETGGVLLLAERAGPGRLRFTVSDTGPGVAEAARERIFEAFTHADPEHGSRLGGAGLGLAIASRIAEAMGGAVGVDGAVGRGADFWFEAAFAAAGEAKADRALSGRSVAIVSPSAILREAAGRQIEACAGRAIKARTVDEALARTAAADVILIDQALAKGRARLKPPAGRAAVVLLKPEERGRIARYRAAGFAGYLIKPLRRASLAARVLAAEGAQVPHPPIDDERIAPAAEAPAAAAPGARVLLAEDNPINAMLARTLLIREGCDVEHVTDGAAALQALADRDYDLVLMDVRMPRLSGMETTKALRARGVKTPVVALTANAFEDDRRACLAAGMDDFLVKPLSPEALRRALLLWTGPGWTAARKHAKLAG
ncbi:MAG TPA: response regulator [Caulobacteraceae bacterium]|jgi:CheY-like chemotaxis protein|nr:response regulator [Caulobacteraceae bacterium]